ncbi:UDP-N-acetylmuramoyl-L-alanine--D-glutamate ligase [Patescibacteria group bacterium]|nr:UDP-N-acetylmuramoyl-L-alanine--D-glutamate ligase [Patescibacteria group bacterium]
MINYFSHFQGKKITLMGLGLLGRGLGVARFLIEQDAQLTITDLKTKRELTDSLKKLSKFKGVKYVLGQHRLADFENRDLIIKSAGVPFDSKYIKEAKKNKISIEMDASLFAKLAPVKIIGITGTRGKSTVTDIVYQILKKHYKKGDVFLGGNVKGIATLPLLKKVKEQDIVVMELDSWQMQGFGDSKISPHIAVFTNFLSDHMNYYRNSMNRYFDDKANIFKYQSKDDYLIISQQANQEIRKRFKSKIKSKIIKISDNKWETKLLGQHNQNNINLAVEVLKILGINKLVIKKELKTYLGMPGRLEFVRTFKEVDYYNDTNSTTPDALMVALNSFNKKVILIAGGNDKELDYKEVVKVIRKKTKAIILIKGTATDKILKLIECPVEVVESMKKAVGKANQFAQKGDIVLLSPGATSFGVFKNEYDRGDQFRELVNKYV